MNVQVGSIITWRSGNKTKTSKVLEIRFAKGRKGGERYVVYPDDSNALSYVNPLNVIGVE